MRCRFLAFGLTLLAASAPARAAVTVAVDPASGAHPISPLVYGMNFPSDQQLGDARVTVGRWGGNSTTRYNYKIDVHNSAADYFFENIPGCWSDCAGNPPADPQEQSSANVFLTTMKAKGVVALFTIPTIGWVPKAPAVYDQPLPCSCVNVGTQFDPYDAQCGDGQDGNGKALDCPNTSAIHQAVDPTWAKAWVQYLVGKYGPANGQRIYALDNEPALWSSTHRDIRKTKLGYDELWQRLRDYAVAVLEADPTAEIAGPAEWGWPNYFCSDADDIQQGCSANSPDRKAHGGQELMAWLLDQAKDYEQKNGKRILHYLDLHYYPQGGNPPEITRSLWDKAYQDPSWIGGTGIDDGHIFLVPRMHAWVDQHYPGTKLAVSEYDFYSHDQAIGAVAYAEVLGIFGREGVDLATAWSTPDPKEAAFAAFKLYRNFDGNGGHFEGVSVKATVGGGDGVEAYAAVSDKRMTIALVNENGGPTDVDVTFGSFEPGTTAALYVNGAGSAIDKKPDVPVQGGKASLTLPGTSIAMLVLDGANPNQLPDGGGSSATTGAGAGGGATTGGPATGSTGAGGGSGGGIARGGDGTTCSCRIAGERGAAGPWALAAAGFAAVAMGRRRRTVVR